MTPVLIITGEYLNHHVASHRMFVYLKEWIISL